MQVLHSRKSAVDLGRVGLMSGIHPSLTGFDLRTLRDTMASYGVAQALINNINNLEAGLAIRPIYPADDLRNGTAGSVDAEITSQVWRQPVGAISYTGVTGAEGTAESIYVTSKNCGNDQKVYIFIGLRATNIGNQHQNAFLKSVMWIFWRKNVKLIDKWHISQLNSAMEPFICAITPIMFKRNDDAEIKVVPNADAVGDGKFDNLELMGLLIEQLGKSVMG